MSHSKKHGVTIRITKLVISLSQKVIWDDDYYDTLATINNFSLTLATVVTLKPLNVINSSDRKYVLLVKAYYFQIWDGKY